MSRDHRVKIGDVFERLTVVEYMGLNHAKQRTWLCSCECGGETTTTTANLLSGTTKSCGCLQRERASATNYIHGETHKTVEYKTWRNIKSRCYNPNVPRYADYGGRGIVVCDEWKDNFPQFLLDMGRKPFKRASIERLNNDGPYSSDNCVWTGNTQQSRNRRSNHLITYNGKTQCLIEWAEELGFNFSTLSARINRYKWSIEKAFETPLCL